MFRVNKAPVRILRGWRSPRLHCVSPKVTCSVGADEQNSPPDFKEPKPVEALRFHRRICDGKTNSQPTARGQPEVAGHSPPQALFPRLRSTRPPDAELPAGPRLSSTTVLQHRAQKVFLALLLILPCFLRRICKYLQMLMAAQSRHVCGSLTAISDEAYSLVFRVWYWRLLWRGGSLYRLFLQVFSAPSPKLPGPVPSFVFKRDACTKRRPRGHGPHW